MLRLALICSLVLAVSGPLCLAAPWITPDWADKEPSFKPGSLFYRTGSFRTAPVIYRTVLDIDARPIQLAGFEARVNDYGFVFLNGRQIAAVGKKDETGLQPLHVELTHLLKPGRNVLVISTTGNGLSLDGGIIYAASKPVRFASATRGWKVQKLAPLTILEDQPLMKGDFDDSGFFDVKTADQPGVELPDQKLAEMSQRLGMERLTDWDRDAAWRLKLLTDKGIVIVDWEAYGFGGAQRVPEWVREIAQQTEPAGALPGGAYLRAEAISQYVYLADEATNFENQAAGLAKLNANAADIQTLNNAAAAIRDSLSKIQVAVQAGQFAQAIAFAQPARAAADQARGGRLVSPLNKALDNKFSWLHTGALLEGELQDLDLTLVSKASVQSSPLSAASLITVDGNDLVLRGWTKTSHNVFNRKPANAAPVVAWAMIGSKLTGLLPSDGVIYDRARHGPLSENWLTLNSDLATGGPLPLELVFLNAPSKISMQSNGKATELTISFPNPAGRVFVVRAVKDVRGVLQQARDLASAEPTRAADKFVEQFRLYSRALLNYPVSYSEAFVRDPQDAWALLVADVYNYVELKDEWNTQPLKLAPLSPMAAYGLLTNYPGLKLTCDATKVGSYGDWGDFIAMPDSNVITYRVPMDQMKVYGGFTSYCFGPTDIGEPGSLTEILSVKATGANSFRPQHNQSSERAMRTAQWCAENGLQNVFNTDEKWVPDVVEFYRTLAEKCKDFPPDAIGYDLLNEPQTREPYAYNVLMKKITQAIRQHDKVHPIYIEVVAPWSPGGKPYPRNAFEVLAPTGDEKTVYSFHDYAFRLGRLEVKEQSSEGQDTTWAYWPDHRADISDIERRWVPAFRYSIDHRAPMHIGEFGGFEQTKQDVYANACALTMMMDYLNIFDQFGWHWHYYANRGTVRARLDGSLEESYVQGACRRYFGKGTFNANRQ